MIFRSSLMPLSLRPLATAAIALACLLAGCGESQKQATASPPKVTVAHPIKRTIVDQDEYVGRFVPVDVVEVGARAATCARAHHQRADLRAARPSLPQRPGLGGG